MVALCVLAMATAGSACGQSQAKLSVSKFEAFVTAACDCKDTACAEKVLDEVVGYVSVRKKASVTDDDRKKLKDLVQRLGTCLSKRAVPLKRIKEAAAKL